MQINIRFPPSVNWKLPKQKVLELDLPMHDQSTTQARTSILGPVWILPVYKNRRASIQVSFFPVYIN
jgi:hypothetical protein